VLYEDNQLLVVDKPAGVLSQADRSGDATVLDWAVDHVRRTALKAGAVPVIPVHRLDRPTSGVLVLARTPKAAARLAAQFRGHEAAKTYRAVVERHGPLPEGETTWTDWIVKDRDANRVVLAPAARPGAVPAVTAVRVLRAGRTRAELELTPRTGRPHQLRVQLAARGLPVVGDAKYGAASRWAAADGGPRIALHAHRLRLLHPTRHEPLEFVAPLPPDWPAS
jgi:23S rRNA pseudouridine1911/1915/1917 synthase